MPKVNIKNLITEEVAKTKPFNDFDSKDERNHLLLPFEGKTYKDYHDAVKDVIETAKTDDELDDYLHTEIDTGDVVTVGNQTIVANDLFDHLKSGKVY